MIPNYQHTVANRFLHYVTIDTQSDASSKTHPSTQKQKDLANILVAELHQMGLTDAFTNEYGYVYATIPSNSTKKTPTICFCSHMDTTSEYSGANVQPIVHKNYQGQDIVLPKDETQVLTPAKYPYLLNQIGNDIITASGDTLLGADDKAGVAIIMDFANYLQTHPAVEHGTIKLLFTTDEEIGTGVDFVDIPFLNAQFGYTLDGGDLGSYEDESFSANYAILTIEGIGSHPGDAKGKMINALKLASAVIESLPKDFLSPESTEKREGFVHPLKINGTAEKTTIEFLIRDFETSNLQKHQDFIVQHTKKVLSNYPSASFSFSINEQYRNMKEIVSQHPAITENLVEAIKMAGLRPTNNPIRGGTDGSKLSFMGLPCPNIFTGMQNIHSKHEWVSISDMQKAVEVLVHLNSLWCR